MKNTFLILISAFLLSACGMFGPARPGEAKIVYVDKAVPFCPKPPEVKQYSYRVDSLTPEDAATPGKVAKDYVYDMTLLRAQVKIYKMIIEQYEKQVVDFTEVTKEIKKIQPEK